MGFHIKTKRTEHAGHGVTHFEKKLVDLCEFEASMFYQASCGSTVSICLKNKYE